MELLRKSASVRNGVSTRYEAPLGDHNEGSVAALLDSLNSGFSRIEYVERADNSQIVRKLDVWYKDVDIGNEERSVRLYVNSQVAGTVMAFGEDLHASASNQTGIYNGNLTDYARTAIDNAVESELYRILDVLAVTEPKPKAFIPAVNHVGDRKNGWYFV